MKSLTILTGYAAVTVVLAAVVIWAACRLIGR